LLMTRAGPIATPGDPGIPRNTAPAGALPSLDGGKMETWALSSRLGGAG